MQIASDPVDVQDLQFKLQCRLKIFDRTEGQPIKNTTNLVATASRFGLIFAGCNSPKLKVVRFASIEDYPSSDAVGNYSRREISLSSVPEHLSVNCDHTKLAVVLEKDKCPVVLFYDVKSFVSQNVQLLNEVRLSTTPNVKVSVANWHPTIDNIFTECKTDGALGIYEIKGNSVDINKLPTEANVTCFCWSPKGKQIAVGSRDGKLTHYKPDLKAVKMINAPPFEKPYSIISLQWISNYQFIGVFKPFDTADDQCCLVLIDAPKAGNPTFTNFYDVCYSNGNYRNPQFYLLFEQHWNIVIVSSANSMEIGVLAGNGESWTQWTLPDTARAELPLDENREETYPVGLAIDTSSVKPVPWGESTLQPAPSLLLMSHQGVLCSFKIINLREGFASFNSPPENIPDLSGLGAFTTGTHAPKPEISKAESQFSIQPIQQQPVIQNPQASKETNFPLSTTTAGSQFSFLTSQVTIQPIQKPATLVQPQVTSASANLFGSQLSIIPKGGNAGNASNTATSLIGSMLLNTGNNASPSTSAASVANFVVPQPSQQISFSSIGQSQPTTIPNEKVSKPEIQTETPPTQFEPQESNEEIEKILAEMIQMECAALEDEMQLVRYQGQQLQPLVKAEDIDLIERYTKDIGDFIKELVETSNSQKSEIHMLKQNTIQTWAWFEEARLKYKDLHNEELKVLWKLKPLDSVSEKHLDTLKKMEYYLESQLKQAHKALDEQWDDFQDFCRDIVRVPMPKMETIFQTLVKQNVVLQRQQYELKELQRQVKARKKKAAVVIKSVDDKNLTLSLNNMTLDPEDIHRIYQQRVLKRLKPPSAEVANHLKNLILSKEVKHVMVKSQVGSSIIQTPPSHRLRSVVQQMTPDIRNKETAKKLNFFQSTPIGIESELPAATAQIPSTPLSAFASTSNVLPSKIDAGENLVRTPYSEAPNAGFVEPVINEQMKMSSLNFGGFSNFGKETVAPSSNQQFGMQLSTTQTIQNQFITSKPATMSTTPSTSGIFSSFNKPSESTAVPQISSSALSFGTSASTLGSTESTIKPLGTNITSFSNKPGISIASSVSTTKSSFFTPITSAQFASLPSTQQAASNITSKASAFAPVTAISTISSSKPAPLTTSSVPATGFSFAFGKSQLVSSSNSSSSAVSTTTAVTTPATSKNTSFNITNILSTASPVLGATSTAASTFGSIFGAASVSSGGFSFGAGAQSTNSNASASGSLFGKGTTGISSSASTTAEIANSSNTFLGAITTTNATVSTSSATTTKSGSLFGSLQPQASRAETGFKSGSVPSSTTPASSETSTTGTIDSGSIFGTSTSSGSLFGTTSTVSTPSLSTTTSEFGKTATIESSVSSLGITTASTTTSSLLFRSITTSTNTTSLGSLFAAATPATTASTPLFGATAPSTANSGSTFGNAASSTTTSGSLFGSTVSSLFGTTASTTSTSTASFGTSVSSTASSLFGTASSTSTPSFGSTAPVAGVSLFSKTSATTTSAGSLFGTTSTSSSSVFGVATTNTGSMFGTVTPTSRSSGSLFGSAVAVTTNTSVLFGTATTSTTGSGSIFGKATPSAASSGSIFGTTGSTSNSGSLFGASKAFGAVAPTSTSAGSVFGTTAPETTKSVFGSASTSGQSVFGTSTTSSPFAATSSFGASTTTTSSSSIFGNSTNSSPFGGGTSAFGSVSAASSPFGAVTSSAAPTFGGTATFGSPATSSASPFGSSPFGSTGNAASPFGTAATAAASPFGNTTTSATSPFGNTPTSVASPFGAAPNTSPFEASTSPFVKPTAFGQSSGFGSSFGATPATSPSIFGQTTAGASNSIFGGSSTSVFGGTTTTSTFGNAGSPFGTTSSAGASSPFGQTASSGGFFGSSQSVFGSPANNENAGTPFGFGSLNVGASTQSPFAKTTETKSPFGPSTFSTSSSGSPFGASSFGNASSSGTLFGQTAFGNTFGNNQQTSGPFSGGSGSVSQSGFGAAPTFQKTTGFGGQPAFGSSPAFGSAPSFGGSPSFGGNASFGSGNKVFGSPSATGVFGSTTQQQQQQPQPTAFGNISNQNTIGFGNLSQQSSNSGQNTGFSGSSSFSSWR